MRKFTSYIVLSIIASSVNYAFALDASACRERRYEPRISISSHAKDAKDGGIVATNMAPTQKYKYCTGYLQVGKVANGEVKFNFARGDNEQPIKDCNITSAFLHKSGEEDYFKKREGQVFKFEACLMPRRNISTTQSNVAINADDFYNLKDIQRDLIERQYYEDKSFIRFMKRKQVDKLFEQIAADNKAHGIKEDKLRLPDDGAKCDDKYTSVILAYYPATKNSASNDALKVPTCREFLDSQIANPDQIIPLYTYMCIKSSGSPRCIPKLSDDYQECVKQGKGNKTKISKCVYTPANYLIQQLMGKNGPSYKYFNQANYDKLGATFTWGDFLNTMDKPYSDDLEVADIDGNKLLVVDRKD